jgi:2-phosphoglycerate kinase
MIYLIGGAPRVGKSILSQQLAAKLNIGWILTNLLRRLWEAESVLMASLRGIA